MSTMYEQNNIRSSKLGTKVAALHVNDAVSVEEMYITVASLHKICEDVGLITGNMNMVPDITTNIYLM